MKKLLTILSVAALSLSAAAVHAKDWTTIRFGVDMSYAPMESKAPDGKPVGFDIDLGNEICKRLNAKCEWVEQDYDGIIPALKARKFDAILSSMTVTPERAKQIDFSNKLFKTPIRLIAKKGSGLLPTAESLKGKSVGVEQGTTAETYGKANWAPKGVKIQPYQNQELVYVDLLSGRMDATLQDELVANLGFLNTPRGAGFEFAGPEIPAGFAAVGLRKEDTDLKDKINGAIADMIKDGTYKKFADKYFTFDVYSGE